MKTTNPNTRSRTRRSAWNTSLTLAGTLLLTALAATLTGCGRDALPTAPGQAEEVTPPAETIRTPKKMQITSITVTKMPAKNGDRNWDLDLSPIDKKNKYPDLYVSLQRPGALPAFASKTIMNAKPSSSHACNRPASEYDGSLPHEFPYGQTYKITGMDDDFGGNTKIGHVTVNPSRIYKKDNATTFTKTLTSGSFKVKIKGNWLYS